ncbi:MAG: hypothetical protein ACOYKA_01815 [Legionellaceae bacterium]
MNYPYQGRSDGFTSSLRKRFSEHDYVGFELESNQALVSETADLDTLKALHARCLQRLLELI